MITQEQVEQAMQGVTTLKALSEMLGVSQQGAILALIRLGLRERYDFTQNRGGKGKSRERGRLVSPETREKLSQARKGKNKLSRGSRNCPECGQEFVVVVGAKNKSDNRSYCSDACKNLAHSKLLSTGVNLTIRHCEVCGIEVAKHTSSFNEKCFCSKEHAGEWRRGKSFEELYGEERAIEIKERIAQTTTERNSNNPPVSKLHLRVKAEMERQEITGFLTSQRFSYFELDEMHPELRLVVEIDGTYWHSSARKQIQDRRKDSFMKNKGYTMLRLKEKEINEDIVREVAKIKEMVKHAEVAV